MFETFSLPKIKTLKIRYRVNAKNIVGIKLSVNTPKKTANEEQRPYEHNNKKYNYRNHKPCRNPVKNV